MDAVGYVSGDLLCRHFARAVGAASGGPARPWTEAAGVGPGESVRARRAKEKRLERGERGERSQILASDEADEEKAGVTEDDKRSR